MTSSKVRSWHVLGVSESTYHWTLSARVLISCWKCFWECLTSFNISPISWSKSSTLWVYLRQLWCLTASPFSLFHSLTKCQTAIPEPTTSWAIAPFASVQLTIPISASILPRQNKQLLVRLCLLYHLLPFSIHNSCYILESVKSDNVFKLLQKRYRSGLVLWMNLNRCASWPMRGSCWIGSIA